MTSIASTRALSRRGRPSRPSAAPLLVALSSLGFAGAAVIHALVVPEHLGEDPLYGWFFIGVTALQAAAAVLVFARPSPRVLRAALAGTVGLIALWAYTRTVGIPMGRSAGEVEAVGTLDLTCQVFQLLSAGTAAAALLRLRRLETA